jgi:hypothetical protein
MSTVPDDIIAGHIINNMQKFSCMSCQETKPIQIRRGPTFISPITGIEIDSKLCNKCGIRYHKYENAFCMTCYTIPRVGYNTVEGFRVYKCVCNTDV